MSSPKSESETDTRQELIEVALDYLKAIADKAKRELGPQLEHVQKSQWMVSTGPGRSGSRIFERKVFDRDKVSDVYHNKFKCDDFSERWRLQEILHKYGKSRGDLVSEFGPFADLDSQLVTNWLRLPSPFSFEETDILNLLDEFADMVLDNKMVYKSLTAIDGLDASLPFSFEDGIKIRQMTEDELWEFGDLDRYKFISTLSPSDSIPCDTWKILDIKLQCDVPDVFSSGEVMAVRDAVIMSLRLKSSGSLRIIDKGARGNYYDIGITRNIKVSRELVGRCEKNYTLDTEMIKCLQDSWPVIRKIIESNSHYLRLPAQRLIEGSERRRFEDAVLDYAIGLERLLTAGLNAELSYRFALRGATILGWEGGNKRAYYKELKRFYDLRSFIVHGSIEPTKKKKRPDLSPSDACSIGEDYLRKIWWWYFENGFIRENDLDDGTKKIDERILSNSIDNPTCRGSRYEEENT